MCLEYFKFINTFICMIEFSERESKLFDLRFGRITIPSGFNDWSKIITESKVLALDYLRIKIVDPDSNFLATLPTIPHRIYLTGIIKLFRKKVEQNPEPYSNSDHVYKKVTPEEKQLFKDLVKEVYTGYPMGYFQYPELNESFPLHLQLENISSYFADHFTGTDEQKEAYIGYREGIPVSCFVVDFMEPKVVACLFAGVVQKYRSMGVFGDASRYLTILAHDRGVKQIVAGARLENISSQYSLSKVGYFYGHEWVYIMGFNK